MEKVVADVFSEIEAEFGRGLPEALKSFFDAGDHERYDGRSVSSAIGSFCEGAGLEVSFADQELASNFEYAVRIGERFGQQTAHLFPFAVVEQTCVAVDITNSELPVKFFDLEIGFCDHKDSFQAFLEDLR